LERKGFCERLHDLEPEFAKLRDKRFIVVDFDDEIVSGAIKTVYRGLRSFSQLGGPASISKVLHLLNPEIFVMWDSSIRQVYHHKNRLVNEFPAGYLEFLKQTRKEIRGHAALSLYYVLKYVGKTLSHPLIGRRIYNYFEHT
jgi:hypothetical protein